MEITRIEQSILEVFRSIKTGIPNICATELYCEGWLLRLALTAWSNSIDCLPFAPAPGSRWFADALLYSAFLAERRGDSLAETHSEADAVVGQFEFGSTKTGVRLARSANQFVVLEAKVFSKLRYAGTRARLQGHGRFYGVDRRSHDAHRARMLRRLLDSIGSVRGPTHSDLRWTF